MAKFWMTAVAILTLGLLTGCADDSGDTCTGTSCGCETVARSTLTSAACQTRQPDLLNPDKVDEEVNDFCGDLVLRNTDCQDAALICMQELRANNCEPATDYCEAKTLTVCGCVPGEVTGVECH